MKKTTLLLALLVLCFTVALAQSKRKKKKQDDVSQIETPNTKPSTLNPTEPKKEYIPKAARKKVSTSPTYTAEARYYDRMEKLEREKVKEEKIKLKPQYSDPLYFGHKRPPKKRKPGKMKFCKECGIRH
jgi:hypothetical protein